MANKKSDNTHFNEKGARAMAGLVMQELPTAAPKLTPYLKTPPVTALPASATADEHHPEP